MAARRPVPVVKDPELWSVFELDQSSPLVVSERWARDLVGTISTAILADCSNLGVDRY